jgi:chemotaxis protein methyltransferase CheR
LLFNEYYDKIRQLIYNESGLHFDDSNRSILESRLREQLEVRKVTIQEYFKLVNTNQQELVYLLDIVTTNLTRFFRNSLQYETLQKFVVPDLVAYKNNLSTGVKHIRLWSAGCSTGEEAYTNAICLTEWLPPDFTFDIVASDISLRSLTQAKTGLYAEAKCKEIPSAILRKYFTHEGDNYRVNDEIKNHIVFDYHNLRYDNGKSNFDIVFCRNVLIYFDEVAQLEVINKFYNAMARRSYLFLGHSESLFGLKTNFEFVRTNWSSLYRKIGN